MSILKRFKFVFFILKLVHELICMHLLLGMATGQVFPYPDPTCGSIQARLLNGFFFSQGLDPFLPGSVGPVQLGQTLDQIMAQSQSIFF